MDALRRLGKIAGWTAAGLVYVWFAAVRNADRVKARKAACFASSFIAALLVARRRLPLTADCSTRPARSCARPTPMVC